MGMLDELLRQLQEAAEQKQRTTLPGQPQPRQPRPQRAAPAQAPAVAERAVVREVDAHDGESFAQRTVADSLAVQGRVPGVHPLLARLRAPGGLREAVILSEILTPRSRRRR